MAQGLFYAVLRAPYSVLYILCSVRCLLAALAPLNRLLGLHRRLERF